MRAKAAGGHCFLSDRTELSLRVRPLSFSPVTGGTREKIRGVKGIMGRRGHQRERERGRDRGRRERERERGMER